MLLIVPGAIICFKKQPPLFWSIFIFTILNVYILSSWWCWWYGGSFGMRPMIDCYGLLAIWLALFLQYLYKKTKPVFISITLLIGFFVYVNLFQTRQARICWIHYDSMTYEAYKIVFLNETNIKKYTAEEWENMLDEPNYEKAKKGERFW
jgi:hypothetical protein